MWAIHLLVISVVDQVRHVDRGGCPPVSVRVVVSEAQRNAGCPLARPRGRRPTGNIRTTKCRRYVDLFPVRRARVWVGIIPQTRVGFGKECRLASSRQHG